MTCIALSGYYGFHNIGDEAILEAVITVLRRHQADVRIVVLSADPLHTRQTYGVEAVSRTHLQSIIRVLREADLLISGGGGLLQDVTGPRSIPYYLGIMELAMLIGTPVAVYAQGMGPVHHRWSRFWMKKVLSRVDWVSVRDLASAQFLAKLGVVRDVVVTADPVLSLEPESSDGINEFWRAHGVEKSEKELLVGVALRPYPGETIFDERLMEIVSRGCSYLESKYGARLVFLPYHLQKDLPLARELASRTSSRSIIIERGLSSRDTLKLMGGLDLLIGMRLHALIFAAICGVPFVALPYDPKINAFLGKIGVAAELSLENLSFEDFLASLETALLRKEEWMANLQEKINEQRKEVEEAALKILSLASPK
ncbi:MAG: polysaccharide pyruvyl transferase CsaB [Bacillota bacterium]|nr:polysaccharide pyruvyl transferase CsaB [Bacillota bacterium]